MSAFWTKALVRRISVEALRNKPIESEKNPYIGQNEDLPDIFFKTAEQIEQEEWEELWHVTRNN